MSSHPRSLARSVTLAVVALAGLIVVAACSSAAPPAGPPPSAVADAYASPPSTDLNVPPPGVTLNDDTQGGTVDEGTVATTAGGSATLFADGRVLYEPPLGFDGFDSFAYTLTNSAGTSDPAAVTIEVPAAPWVSLPALAEGRSRPAGAVVDGTFYLVGGETTGGTRPTGILAYRRATGTWDDSRAAMPTGVSNHCVTTVGTDLYVVGGYIGTGGVDLLQRYDTVDDTWTVVGTDPLPTALFANTCQTVDGMIYVFGGDPAGLAGTTSWRYDPDALPGTRWKTDLAPLPIALHYAASAVVDGNVFVLGGLVSDSAAVYSYDPGSDAWTPYPDMLEGRGGAAAWSVGPILYAGGGGWSSYHTSVEAYDTRNGTSGSWVAAAALATGRRTLAYDVDPDQGWLYAVGGWAGTFVADAEEGMLRASVP